MRHIVFESLDGISELLFQDSVKNLQVLRRLVVMLLGYEIEEIASSVDEGLKGRFENQPIKPTEHARVVFQDLSEGLFQPRALNHDRVDFEFLAAVGRLLVSDDQSVTCRFLIFSCFFNVFGNFIDPSPPVLAVDWALVEMLGGINGADRWQGRRCLPVHVVFGTELPSSPSTVRPKLLTMEFMPGVDVFPVISNSRNEPSVG
jgi:hypothetical protein